MRSATCRRVRLRRFSRSSQTPRTCLSPRPRASSEASLMRTATPASEATPGDARPHEAGAEHPELPDLHRRRPLRIAGVLADLLGREEDRDEAARDVADREAAEGPGLELQALLERRGRAPLHHLHRLERRGSARRSSPGRRSRLREDDAAAGGAPAGRCRAGTAAARRRPGRARPSCDLGQDRRRTQLVHEPRARARGGFSARPVRIRSREVARPTRRGRALHSPAPGRETLQHHLGQPGSTVFGSSEATR